VEVSSSPDGIVYRIEAAAARGTDGPGEIDLRPAVFELARDKGWPVKELRRDVRTLETVFNELVTAAGGNEQ